MKNNRTIAIMARTDIETKQWIDGHPLSQSDLINYGLNLIRQMEERINKAEVRINTISVQTPIDTTLPEWAQ